MEIVLKIWSQNNFIKIETASAISKREEIMLRQAVNEACLVASQDELVPGIDEIKQSVADYSLSLADSITSISYM